MVMRGEGRVVVEKERKREGGKKIKEKKRVS
jgi:hypothetical protein